MRPLWYCLLVLLAACSTPTSPTPAPTAQLTLPTEILAAPQPTVPTIPAIVGVERILYTVEVDAFTQLFAAAPDGSAEIALSSKGEDVFAWALAPNGQRLALATSRGETSDIVWTAINRGAWTTVARNLANASQLTWSPNASRLAFVVASQGFANGANEDIHAVNTNGTGLAQLTNHPLPELAAAIRFSQECPPPTCTNLQARSCFRPTKSEPCLFNRTANARLKIAHATFLLKTPTGANSAN